MTERNVPRLPEAAEAVLSEWPVPQRSDADWDQSAAAVLDRLKSGEEVAVDEALLAPPLPRTASDGVLPDRRSSPDAAGPSLAEIARSKIPIEDRSRQLAVAKDSLKHVANARHTGETAQHVARAAELTELQRYREERQSSVPDDRGAGWRGAVVGATLALLAAAAAFVLYVSGQKTETPAPADHPPPIADLTPHEATESAPTRKTDEPLASLSDLPVEEAEKAEAKAAPVRRARPTVARAQSSAKAAGPAVGALEPDEFDTKLPSADDSDISKRLAPTTGEALAAVAPSTARAKVCVAGHSKQSTATVTFGSDGRVRSVQVSGPAAGTPATECIQNAFMNARVAPFAKPQFTVNLPVRP